MLHFSDRALAVIQKAISDKQPTPAGLRLGLLGSQCSGLRYVIRLEAEASAGDRIVQYQNLTLFIDPDSFDGLQGVQVDFVERDGESGFSFDNSNFSAACSGCSKNQAA